MAKVAGVVFVGGAWWLRFRAAATRRLAAWHRSRWVSVVWPEARWVGAGVGDAYAASRPGRPHPPRDGGDGRGTAGPAGAAICAPSTAVRSWAGWRAGWGAGESAGREA